jgi:hypothetical protein
MLRARHIRGAKLRFPARLPRSRLIVLIIEWSMSKTRPRLQQQGAAHHLKS